MKTNLKPKDRGFQYFNFCKTATNIANWADGRQGWQGCWTVVQVAIFIPTLCNWF